jgi:hypothetical protein
MFRHFSARFSQQVEVASTEAILQPRRVTADPASFATDLQAYLDHLASCTTLRMPPI